MRIEVDHRTCESNGICVGIIPEVFELDDKDELRVLQPEVTPEVESRVRDAVAQCPRAAISLIE
ncbi:ferredoxin [Nocardia gipuzkoensis]|uniref:ferredoxin n=1 Tax=Nocardia gipuzkoensis TaxID=2749991 RepID=UPI0015EF5A22|nr:ferredoxin [Nocardia gipuzkoensis]